LGDKRLERNGTQCNWTWCIFLGWFGWSGNCQWR